MKAKVTFKIEVEVDDTDTELDAVEKALEIVNDKTPTELFAEGEVSVTWG